MNESTGFSEEPRDGVRGQLGEKAGKLKEDLRDLGSLARDAAQEQVHKLEKQGLGQAKRAAEQVKSHPLTSVCIAAGIGVVIGLMLRKA